MSRLDHIGIAVESIESAARLWIDHLGLESGEIEEVAGMGVRALKIEGAGSTIELLEDAAGGDGVIGKFVDRRGPGLHHLSFEVENLAAALERLTRDGFRALYEEPRIGAGGWRVNFLHPRDAQGVLIELMERPQDVPDQFL